MLKTSMTALPLKILLLILITFSSFLNFAQFEGLYLKEKLALIREVYTKDQDGTLANKNNFEAFIKEILIEKSIQINTLNSSNIVISDNIKYTLPETVVLQLINDNPEFYEIFQEYVKEIVRIKKSDLSEEQAKILEAKRIALRAKLSLIFEDPKVEQYFKLSLTDIWTFKAVESLSSDPIQIFFTTPKLAKNGSITPPSNLIDQIVQFIDEAQVDLSLNVYELDIKEIAEALVRAKERGVLVQVGIDSDSIEHSSRVTAIYQYLLENEVNAMAIDSVGINHQKMITKDIAAPGKSGLIMSTGNFTYSGLHPLGDIGVESPERQKMILELPNFESEIKPYAQPNANHLIVIKSDKLALFANHNMQYSFNGLRGAEYPLSGAYELEDMTSKNSYFMTFAPQGGLDNINVNFIGKMIEATKTPHFYLTAFAFSSESITQALLKKLASFTEQGLDPLLQAIGDPSFSARDWSQMLEFIGYQSVVDPETEITLYNENPESTWAKTLPPEVFNRIKENIFVGDLTYGEKNFTLPDGTSLKVSSKVHSKVITSEDYSLVGNSFNLTSSAEKNNEQLLITTNKEIINELIEAQEYLMNEAHVNKRTLLNYLEKRNTQNLYKIKQVKELKDSILKRLKAGEFDSQAISKYITQMNEVLSTSKTQSIISKLGSENPEVYYGKSHVQIIEIENNIISQTQKGMTLEDFKVLYEAPNSTWRGAGFKDLLWSLKTSPEKLNLISVNIEQTELIKIFDFLYENKEISEKISPNSLLSLTEDLNLETTFKNIVANVDKGSTILINYSSEGSSSINTLKKWLISEDNTSSQIQINFIKNTAGDLSTFEFYITNKADKTLRELTNEEILNWKFYNINCNEKFKQTMKLGWWD